MDVLVTGANGTVGRFISKTLMDNGCRVIALGRRPAEDLDCSFHAFDLRDQGLELPKADALVHCALLHEPGKFRGGEGNDPKTFEAANVLGTQRLFLAAKKSGCRLAVFLSSRAVYGDHRRGERLFETDSVSPDTLYGEVKVKGEHALEAECNLGFKGVVLRATGVYGRSWKQTSHKWGDMFEAFEKGEEISSRVGTEVHGEDLAAAVLLAVSAAQLPIFDVWNVSDLVLDRSDLLGLYSELAGIQYALPKRSHQIPGVMDTKKLKSMGWVPGGEVRLRTFLKEVTLERRS